MHARNRRGAYSLFLASIPQKNTKQNITETRHHENKGGGRCRRSPLKKLSRSLQDNPFDLSDDDEIGECRHQRVGVRGSSNSLSPKGMMAIPTNHIML
jgi:hypothetical protein